MKPLIAGITLSISALGLLQGCGSENDLKYHIDSVLVSPVETAYGTAFPIDSVDVESDFALDEDAGEVNANVTILYAAVSEKYKPLLAIPSKLKNLRLEIDGVPATTDTLKDVELPQAAGDTYAVINRNLSIGLHYLTFHYTLETGVEFLSRYVDSSGKGLQAYAPCNPMLFDQFKYHGKVTVTDSQRPFQFFSNATVTPNGANSWSFTHDRPVNALAPFFHLLPKENIVGSTERTFNGQRGPVKITAYRTSSDAPATAEIADAIAMELGRFESTLGPYSHGDKFVAYVESGTGGMEFAGATITSESAAAHEVFHSWFATGVLPRYYADAWIDEALARWYDKGNPVEQLSSGTTAIRLAGYNPYHLYFTQDAYDYGSKLIAHLAWLAGGKDAFVRILADFYKTNALQTVTTEMLQVYLEQKMGQNLDAFFLKYIYAPGGAASAGGQETFF